MLFVYIPLFAASAAAARWIPGPPSSKTSINGKGNLWGINSNNNSFYCNDYNYCNGLEIQTDLSIRFTQISHNDNNVVCGLGIINGNIWCKEFLSIEDKEWKKLRTFEDKKWIDVSVNDDDTVWGVTEDFKIMFCQKWKDCLTTGGIQEWEIVPTPGLSTGFEFSLISSNNPHGSNMADSTEHVACALQQGNGNIYCTSKIGRDWSNWIQLKGTLSEISVNNDGSLWGVKQDKSILYCSNWKKCLSNDWNLIGNLPGDLTGGLSHISSTAGILCGVDSTLKIRCAVSEVISDWSNCLMGVDTCRYSSFKCCVAPADLAIRKSTCRTSCE